MKCKAKLLTLLVVAALVQLCAADIASSLDDATPPLDSSTQPYPSTVTSVEAIASPTGEEGDSSTFANDAFENSTEASSATTSIRRIRQVLSSDAMTRMRPPPPPRVSPYPFWPQTSSPKNHIIQHPNQVHSRSPQTLQFPQRAFTLRPPQTRILQPQQQTFSVQTGFNPTLFTSNPFPAFTVFNTFDPNRQRPQDFQGQFGSINQNSVNQETQQTNPVQAVIGFPIGQRLQNFQDLNNVVQIVQGPTNNGQPVTLNNVHTLLQHNGQTFTNTVLPPRNSRQPILNNAGNKPLNNQINGQNTQNLPDASQNRPQDLQHSASSQQQTVLNEVQDFSTLLNTAPHLQAAFGGGNTATTTTTAPETRKKATLKEILAEDCPLASQMGYCPSPPRYPAHQVGVITRQCEQIMSSLYAPLPAQDSIVSTTLRSAVLSSSNASDMERGNRQIWSWARYSQEKPELDTEQNMMCSSVRREMEPGYARDMSSGRWFVVIQANNRYSQRVTVDKCAGEGEPCSGLKGAHCTGFRTRFKQSACVQRHSYISLITWDPDQPQQCPKMRLFKFPTACVCQLN